MRCVFYSRPHSPEDCPAGRILHEMGEEKARRVFDEFNRRHSVCSPAPKYRCRTCGCLLILKDRCPMHASSVRLVWTSELAAAYWVVVQAYASGLTPQVPMAQGQVYAQAVDLARRWGGHRVVSLRNEVVA